MLEGVTGRACNGLSTDMVEALRALAQPPRQYRQRITLDATTYILKQTAPKNGQGHGDEWQAAAAR